MFFFVLTLAPHCYPRGRSLPPSNPPWTPGTVTMILKQQHLKGQLALNRTYVPPCPVVCIVGPGTGNANGACILFLSRDLLALRPCAHGRC